MSTKISCLTIVRVIIVVCIGFATFSCNNTNITKVKVGVILPLSGEASSYGLECKKGIEYALDNINKSAKDKYDVVFEDSKGDPKTSVSVINKLLNIDKVSFIIGDMFSNTTLSMAPIANEKKILLLSPTASSIDIPKTGLYSLSIFPPEDYEASLMAEYAYDKGYKNVCVIYQQVSASETMKKSFSDVFVQKGGKIAIEEAFPSNTKDFRNVLSKVKENNVDAIYLIAYTEPAIIITKQINEMKINLPILSQSALYDPNFIEKTKDYLTEITLTAPYFNDMNKDSSIVNFRNRFNQKYGGFPNQMSAQGYDALFVANEIFLLLQKNGNDISNAINAIKFKGVTGETVFGKDGKVKKPLSIISINKGRTELIR